MSQVSPVVEEVAVDGEVDLDMDGVEEVDLNMEKVKVEEAADSDVVAMEVLVVAVEEESITIATRACLLTYSSWNRTDRYSPEQ